MELSVNSRNTKWMVDTGAICSVCGMEIAIRCGLVSLGRCDKLIGVGL